MRLPMTLARYVASQFGIYMLMALGIFVSLIFLLDMIELLRRTAEKQDIPSAIIIELTLLKLPDMVQKILPFAVLLGAILALARMSRSMELVAARSTGVSVWQLLTPGIAIAFGTGLFSMMVFDPLSSAMLSRYEMLEARYMQGRTSLLSVSASGLWLRQKEYENDKVSETIVHALRVSQDSQLLYDVTFFNYGPDETFLNRIDADTARLDIGRWIIRNALVTAPGRPAERKEAMVLPTSLTLAQIQDSFAPPETISFWQLPGFIATLEEAGFSAIRHKLHWLSMLAMPFMLCAMVYIAAAFSMRLPRRGRTGLMISGGILAGFVVYFMSDLIFALGLSGRLPLLLAAWAPAGVAIFMGLATLLHFEDG